MKSLVSKIKTIVFNLVKCWQKLTPVKQNLVLFESVGDMCDNSYPVFEYLLKNTNKYRFVWVVGDPLKYKNTKTVKYISFSNRKPSSIYYQAKAKYCFYTHEPCGVEGKRSQERIYLTHGFSYKNTKGRFWNVDFNSAVVRLSDYHRKFGDMCNPGEMELSVSLGYPRNDVLLNNEKATIRKNIKCEKLFVWLPTYRTHRNNSTIYVDKDSNEFNLINHNSLAKLNEVLKNGNSYLVVKYHPAQKLEKADFENFTNIKIYSDDEFSQTGMKLYELLAESDALITDFSSVYADYLLTDKPIAFELSDYEKYKEGGGFIIDEPLEHLPGRFIFSVADLSDFINDVIAGRDEYRAERERERNLIHKYKDGNSAERVLKYFKLL